MLKEETKEYLPTKEQSLIEYYKKFDATFFSPKTWMLHLGQIKELIEQYPDFKNNPDLEQVLRGEKTINEIPEATRKGLRELIDEKEVQESSRQYHQLLENEILNNALRNEVLVDELPVSLLVSFGELISCEKKHSDRIRKNLTQKDLGNLTEQQKRYIVGRIAPHLYRLLKPKEYSSSFHYDKKLSQKEIQNTVCKTFAQDFIEYSGTRSNRYEAKHVVRGIGIEGIPVVMFWTVAPYIHDELKQLDNTPKKAMRKIFNWIRKASESTQRTDDDISDLNFKYAQFANFIVGQRFQYVLGYDERMPSHLLSRLLAKPIAKSLHQDKKF